MFRGAMEFNGVDSAVSCATLIKDGVFSHTGKAGEITCEITDKMAPCELNINAGTFVDCLKAFGAQKAKFSTGANGAMFMEAGDLTVVTSQLRAA